MNRLLNTISRRWERMRRRRKVGRAYDMALEMARILRPQSAVLDVGCGNGFIAHHLTGIMNSTVVGIDVGSSTTARINYVQFDGRHFPFTDQSFDTALLCYVLHHAQDPLLLLEEVHRVLKEGGLTIVYEDNPASVWDRVICWTHNQQWQRRTGRCRFELESDWRRLFGLAGFRVIHQRGLSRWRNMAHPVSRNFFVLTNDSNARISPQSRFELVAAVEQVEIPVGM